MSVKVWAERIKVLDFVLHREDKAAAGVLGRVNPNVKAKKSPGGGERRVRVGRTQSSVPGIGG